MIVWIVFVLSIVALVVCTLLFGQGIGTALALILAILTAWILLERLNPYRKI